MFSQLFITEWGGTCRSQLQFEHNLTDNKFIDSHLKFNNILIEMSNALAWSNHIILIKIVMIFTNS